MLESGSIGSNCAGAKKELVEEDESRTIGNSTIRQGDESDWPPPSDKKTISLLFSQGDFGPMLGEERNGEGVRNRANGWGKSLWAICQF